MQIFWLTVNTQVPFFTPSHSAHPGVTTALPQHFVTVAPVFANGETVTGTQTEDIWYATVGQVCSPFAF